MSRRRLRLSAAERRDQILAAAFAEFAARGYHAAATADIARRAGISQPYIYALFADKKALFLACHERAMERLRALLHEAAGPPAAAAARAAFGRIERAFQELYTSDPDQLMFQLQSHAAASDAEIRAVIRRRFMNLIDEGVRVTGAPRASVLEQLARGLLLAVTVALDLPARYRLRTDVTRRAPPRLRAP